MSKNEISALSIDEEVYLQGTVTVDSPGDNLVPVAVVIVDDNSGSMQGARCRNCVLKSKAIVSRCRELGVPYQYATFGTVASQKGQCSVEDVFLMCSEGTRLQLLSEAALKATENLIPLVPPDREFRVIYVLNTDGEASDGKQAGEHFVAGYDDLRAKWPHMLPARTFVLGIGAHHDQKVLGAMSVGEASYFNYPDGVELEGMVTDTEKYILPELSGTRRNIDLSLNWSGRISVSGEVVDGTVRVDLSGKKISPRDTTITTPEGSEWAIRIQVIETTDVRYFDMCVQSIQSGAMELLKEIKDAASDKSKYDTLAMSCQTLVARLLSLPDPELQEFGPLSSTVLSSRGEVPRSRIYENVRARMKKLRGQGIDRKAGVRSVLTLCETGLHSLRLGSALSKDVERDFMEVLGSGGFQHWTEKKKSRVTNRALGQVNATAVQEVDAKVTQLLASAPPLADDVFVDRSEEEDEDISVYDHPSRRLCWLTLAGDRELTECGDVLCLVGYIPRGSRNLPLCSVSSAKVLHNAILSGEVQVCTHPMSFLTIRELLIEGKEISRGPSGAPINTCLCLLPVSGSYQSARLANCYAPLLASQLLTSRWIYTEGTSEYRNGVLSTLMSLVSAGVSSSNRVTLTVALEGFCRTYSLQPNFLNDVISRAANFTKGASTGGEVSTPLVAVADQMVMLCCYQKTSIVKRSVEDDVVSRFASTEFWRALFMRLLRDRVDRLFTAFCSPGDPEGDAKRRQKDIEAERFVELLVQGVNADLSTVEGLGDISEVSSLDAFFQAVGSLCLSTVPRREERGVGAVDSSDIDLDLDMMNLASLDIDELELDDFEEEAALEDSSSGSSDLSGKQQTSSQAAATSTAAPAPEESIPETTEMFVHWGMELLRTQPARGSPASLLSDEVVVEMASDSLRRVIVLRLLTSLKRELRFLLNASVHMMYQISEGADSDSDVTAMSLFELLGIEPNESGVRWLVSQIVIAIKLRSNGSFRMDVASGSDGLTQQESDSIIRSINEEISRKQQAVWQDEEKRRLTAARQRLRTKYLSHPFSLAPCPLRIRDDFHLAQINDWCSLHRGFKVVRAREPVKGECTGMAKNTFLTPRSPYFMEPVDPFVAITDVFGAAEEREQSTFCEHLHTFARVCFDEVQKMRSSADSEARMFEVFYNRLLEQYGPHKMCLPEGVALWVSMTLDTHFGDIEDARALLLRQLQHVEDVSVVQEIISRECEWHTDPGRFLDTYFREDEVQARREALSLEEFLSSCLPSDCSEEDRVVAQEVHAAMATWRDEMKGAWK